MIAIINKDLDAVNVFLKFFPNHPHVINVQGRDGQTAFHRACSYDCTEIVQAMLLAYPNTPELITTVDKYGYNALTQVLNTPKTIDLIATTYPEEFKIISQQDQVRLKHSAINAHINFTKALMILDDYAATLGETYNNAIHPHIDSLKQLATQLQDNNTNQNLVKQQMQETYKQLLEQTTTHRHAWKPILLNLCIAASGIGLIFIAANYLINHRLGFFSRTNREECAHEIEKYQQQMFEHKTFK